MMKIKRELEDCKDNVQGNGKRKRSDPMSDSCVYTIWNTKGGVGKSTLTFHIASQYAKTHPTRRVLVIDMCPQANVSTALLGASAKPESSTLKEIREELVEEETVSGAHERYFKSISGIILMLTQNKVQNWDPSKYLVKINDYNTKMPTNMFLLPGDATLELTGKSIDRVRRSDRTPNLDPWKEGTLIVRQIVTKLAENYKDFGLTVFIDTNPAFSVYTECAIAAADKLIIPINADDFSNAACKSMLGCIYGEPFDTTYDHEMFRYMKKEVFPYRAIEAGLRLPKIHLIVNNRVTIYNLRASKVFKEMGNVILEGLRTAYNERPEIFSPAPYIGETEAERKAIFEHVYFKELNDFHQTAVQSIHDGAPLYSLSYGPSTTTVGDVKAPINKQTLEGYRKNLEEIVRKID